MPTKRARRRVKAEPTNSAAERKWGRAKATGKPTHDAKGKFIKGNPGGGRPKEPIEPIALQEFRAKVPDLLGVLLHEALAERDHSMIRLALAYGIGTPITRSETLHLTAVAALPSETLNKLIAMGKDARALAPGETLTVMPDDVLDGVGIEVIGAPVIGEFVEVGEEPE